MNILIKKILITLFFLLSFILTIIGAYIRNLYILCIGISIFCVSIIICIIIKYYSLLDIPHNHKIIDDHNEYF
jgi:hypothetical protein